MRMLPSERGLEWLDVPPDSDSPLLEFWKSVGVDQELPFIFTLSPDTLLDIFTRILPSSTVDSNVMTNEGSAHKYFSTMAPYNVSRVCRYWRQFVFASPSLWHRFALLSFRDPSNIILKNAISHLTLHLEKSHDMPIFCAISMIGCYASIYTVDVLQEMERHQKRWRKVKLWFDSVPSIFYRGSYLDNDCDKRERIDHDDEDDDHYQLEPQEDYFQGGVAPPPGLMPTDGFVTDDVDDAYTSDVSNDFNEVEQQENIPQGGGVVAVPPPGTPAIDAFITDEVHDDAHPDTENPNAVEHEENTPQEDVNPPVDEDDVLTAISLDSLSISDSDSDSGSGNGRGHRKFLPRRLPRLRPEVDSSSGSPTSVISPAGSPASNADLELLAPAPAPATYDTYVSPRLFTEELIQLEELSLNNAHVFRLQSTKDNIQPGLIHSLRRLTLEMSEDCKKLAQWLQIAPNLEELNVAFYSSDTARHEFFADQPICLEHLQKINITRGLRRDWDSHQLHSAAKAGVFVMRYLTCPALTRLSVRLGGDECVQHLLEFFTRSSPPLQTLDLHIIDRPSTGDGGQFLLLTRINEALTHLPTITTFRLASRSIDNVGLLLEALQSRATPLLPSLEHLEFLFACAQPSQFVDLVRSRWRVPRTRTLRTLILEQCLTRRYGPRLPLFSSKKDPLQLPSEWVGVKEFMQEGMRFEVI
ncbi:hypothetical protein SCHPADRAFT_942262 [Schizopora paradoxa]|uniref:Uncharacterized protein n=1 Tax=Schizopora paradoxa TaxID=27342 RepID=A0A0H2RHV8_9AGAM|nr:hypothetical protein SCHPADRAFT_942262 [Schizopora paradoxa]